VKADLHIHSAVSDGSDTIEQIMDTAKKKGLRAIAITDHDTLSHLHLIPDNADITIVGGVEISAFHLDSKTKAHILGYNIEKPYMLAGFLRIVLMARNRNSEKQIEILLRQGFDITKDKIAKADGKIIYKQHIMQWLVSTGQVPDMFGEFYQKTFKNGGVCDFDICYPDVFETVKAVKKAGGLAVLAHPGQQQNFWMIPELVKNGLDGLELNHPANSEKDKDILRGYADQYSLFLTGGSDYHGKYEHQSAGIGEYLSEKSGVRAICL